MSSAKEGAHIREFRSTMEREGLVFKGELQGDGILHRVYIEGDKPGSRNGWYKLNLDGRPAGAFGTWKGAKFKWVAARETTRLSVADYAAHREKMAAAIADREAQEQRRYERAAAWAQAIWDAAQPAPSDHPYLKKKGIHPHGIRVASWTVGSPLGHAAGTWRASAIANALIVPIRDKKKIISMQAIFASDENPLKRGKDFLAGARKKGGYFTIGSAPLTFDGKKVVVFAEGFATAASIHEATGHLVVVCFDVGNLQAVAQAFRAHESLAGAILLMAADSDQWTAGNPGVTQARQAALSVGGLLAVPAFSNLTGKPTDFNDLSRREGPDTVKAQIGAAIKQVFAAPDFMIGRSHPSCHLTGFAEAA
jgi:putative DNA primase/helicase